MCPAASGKPMQSSDLLCLGLHAALRRAGIRQVRFHDLRHSVASKLLGAGVDVLTISEGPLARERVHHAHDLPHAIARHGAGCRGRAARLMAELETKWKHRPLKCPPWPARIPLSL